MKHLLTIVCLLILFVGQAQHKIDQFFEPSDTLNPQRLKTTAIATAAGFTGMMLYLDGIWYDQYERESFHFYKDGDEWLQIDKVGHAWTSYQGAMIGQSLLEWSGVEYKKATLYGAPFGFLFLTGVEIMDGYSSGWGFSATDMLANTIGMSLYAGQELGWAEQRVRLKYSIEPVDYYNHPEVSKRIDDIYGSGLQKIFKDYNAQTYWLSVTPASFMHEDTTFPKWLAVSLGYSADGLLGGRYNYWCSDSDIKPEDCPYAQRIDFSNQVDRTRQFYLSLDVDLSNIETNSAFLNTVLGTINMVKIPAPAIELTDGDIHFRAIR